MMTSAITKFSPVRIEIAAAPNTELIPSQPMQLSQFSRPGTTIDLPYASRASGIWAMPVFGPIVARSPTSTDPTTFPTTIAASAVQKPSPMNEAAASVPRKNAAGTRFGVNHTVKTRATDPYRADSGIGSIPCPSIDRSPSREGMPCPVRSPAVIDPLLPRSMRGWAPRRPSRGTTRRFH